MGMVFELCGVVIVLLDRSSLFPYYSQHKFVACQGNVASMFYTGFEMQK
jgi:hypothetical protein